MTLEPTPHLRWIAISRYDTDKHPDALELADEGKPRVLQQWWRDVKTGDGEWRDVPLEAE